MKLTYSIVYIFLLSGLFISCQENECVLGQETDKPTGTDRTVDLVFSFSGEQTATRTFNEGIATEEGKVKSLIYAVFQNRMLRKRDFADLVGGDYDTASGKKYIVSGIDNQYLNEYSEIFAVANASEKMTEDLMSDKPDYKIPDDDPIITKLVEEKIDSLARAEVYNFLIGRRYVGNVDNKIHYFPINKDNYIEKNFDFQEYTFTDYPGFVANWHRKDLPAYIKARYDSVYVDLQCRLVIYQSGRYENNVKKYTETENSTHEFRTSFQSDPNLKQYMFWRNYTYASDLNDEASKTDSRLIEDPLMAGYYALEDNFGSVITVSVEHIYSRIWFNFQWMEVPEAEQIVIDSVVVERLLGNTNIFNTAEDMTANNPSSPLKGKTSIRNKAERQEPFLANWSLSAYPWHLGDGPQVLLQRDKAEYEVLCRYQWTNGKMDTSKHPIRYYVYSYQWGGVYPEDDPLVSVYYHFQKKTEGEVIYKKATALLYDDTHLPGKRHHGLLRNYTYKLNCMVNTVTNKLDIQVVSVPWFNINIDDIPPFE
jgi:hypothetical protein